MNLARLWRLYREARTLGYTRFNALRSALARR
jgi:hypothetical protein